LSTLEFQIFSPLYTYNREYFPHSSSFADFFFPIQFTAIFLNAVSRSAIPAEHSSFRAHPRPRGSLRFVVLGWFFSPLVLATLLFYFLTLPCLIHFGEWFFDGSDSAVLVPQCFSFSEPRWDQCNSCTGFVPAKVSPVVVLLLPYTPASFPHADFPLPAGPCQ